jgi:hypothetical protein
MSANWLLLTQNTTRLKLGSKRCHVMFDELKNIERTKCTDLDRPNYFVNENRSCYYSHRYVVSA